MSETKAALSPIMTTRAQNCIAFMTVKVKPKAPRAGGGAILEIETGVMRESLGLVEQLAVLKGKCLA